MTDTAIARYDITLKDLEAGNHAGVAGDFRLLIYRCPVKNDFVPMPALESRELNLWLDLETGALRNGEPNWDQVVNLNPPDWRAFAALAEPQQIAEAWRRLEARLQENAPRTINGEIGEFYAAIDCMAKLSHGNIALNSDMTLQFLVNDHFLRVIGRKITAWYQPHCPGGCQLHLDEPRLKPRQYPAVYPIALFQKSFLTHADRILLKSWWKRFITANATNFCFSTLDLEKALELSKGDDVQDPTIDFNIAEPTDGKVQRSAYWQPVQGADAWHARQSNGRSLLLRLSHAGPGVLMADILAPGITVWPTQEKLIVTRAYTRRIYGFRFMATMSSEGSERLALIERHFRALIEPRTPVVRSGRRFDEMDALLRGIALTLGAELTVGLGAPGLPAACYEVDGKAPPKSVMRFIAAILQHFDPSGAKPKIDDGILTRTDRQDLVYGAGPATGHDLIEAGEQVANFLEVNDLGLSRHALAVIRKTFGIG